MLTVPLHTPLVRVPADVVATGVPEFVWLNWMTGTAVSGAKVSTPVQEVGVVEF